MTAPLPGPPTLEASKGPPVEHEPVAGVGRMVGVAAVAVVIGAFLLMAVPNLFLWTRVADSGIPAETDYLAFAAGGELAREAPAQLYDMAAQQDVELALSAGAPCCPVFRPFVNPPHVAVLYGALGADGFRTGYVAAAVVNLALVGGLVVAVHQLARPLTAGLRGLLLAGTVAASPVAAAMLQGGPSAAAALGMSLVVLGDRHRRANLVAAGLLLATCKPHFLVLPLLWLAARSRWRPIGRFVLLGAATVVATLPLIGIGPWLRYPDALLHYSDAGSGLEVDPRYWWNLVGSLTSLGLDHRAPWLEGLGWMVFAIAAGGLMLLTRRGVGTSGPKAPLAAVVLVLGILAVPHANPHDALVVAPAMALALTGAEEAGAGRLPWAILVALAASWPVATFGALLADQRGALAHLPVGLLAILGLVASWMSCRPGLQRHPAG